MNSIQSLISSTRKSSMWRKIKVPVLLSILFLIPIFCFSEDVRILPMRGGFGTAKIAPGNSSSTAYRMDFAGQQAICFQSAGTVDFFVSSASVVGINGWGFYNTGDSLCLDLTSGTTLYFYGDGAGADCRAFFVK